MGFWGAQVSDKPIVSAGFARVLFSFYQPKIEMSGLFILEGSNSGTMTLGFLILINLVFEDNVNPGLINHGVLLQ